MSILGSSSNPSSIRRSVREFIVNNGFLHKTYSIGKKKLLQLRKSDDYHKWITQVEQPNFTQAYTQQPPEQLLYQPTISILLPMFNVKPAYLQKAINSVLAQKYQNWELCIHDDASSRYVDENTDMVQNYMRTDNRIKFSQSENNENISLSMNKASKLATGEYVTFLDQDDELSPYALYFVVRKLNENKKLKFIYTDEDTISDIKKADEPIFRKSHFCKPDWSPDTLLSMMYTTHLAVYDRKLFNKVGGYRAGYEGSQDYDLVIRATELIEPGQIAHIPHILYHWRTAPTSTSNAVPRYKDKHYEQNKSKISSASYKATKDALERRSLSAKIKPGLTALSREIVYEIKAQPKVNIIVTTKNRAELLAKCLDSIKGKSSYKNYSVVIVDNRSDEPEALELLDQIPTKYGNNFSVIKYNKPYNFSDMNNVAVDSLDKRTVKSSHLLFLNNDTEVISSDWIESMLMHSQRDDIGVVGALLLYPNDTVQHAGLAVGTGVVSAYLDDDDVVYTEQIEGAQPIRIASEYHKYFSVQSGGYMDRLKIVSNVSAVTGACMMVKYSLFEKVGGFDAKTFPINYNDIDFCLKVLELGKRNIFTPFAKLYHHESITRKEYTFREGVGDINIGDIRTFREKWRKYIEHDPYYNPNLNKETADFEIAKA